MSKFQLHSSIQFVVESKYSLLIDTQKGSIYRLNEDFTRILRFLLGKTKAEIDRHTLSENITTFTQELIEMEIGDFEVKRLDYDKLQFQDYSLGEIENAIFEFSINNYYLMKNVVQQFVDKGCKFIEFRFLDEISIEVINDLLLSLNKSIVSGITLIFKVGKLYNIEDLIKVMDDHYRVHKMYIFSSQELEAIKVKSGTIYYLTEDLDNRLCGAVREEVFANNFHMNTSKNYNSCLYKKVFISDDGNVKNCPSLQFSFGNIFIDSLQFILDNTEIKKLWFIKKDMIHICRDCEFRHICTDCRAYIESPNDILSKPLKCGYDPYTGEWSEWSSNSLKQTVIEYYGMEKIAENHRDRIKTKLLTN